MKREILFSMESPYRDTFRIQGFRFGEGEKTLAIVGAMRGDEIQQQYICSQLVRHLLELENQGKLANDYQILIVPSANPFSMNIEKRFWAMDNTDINRMFPGYSLGETTQRIAAGVFEKIQGYEYGIQFASFYIPGDFLPHVKIMQTEYMDVEAAKDFALPYVVLRNPRPYDTTTLNYNWQIWNTKAFSLYARQTNSLDKKDAEYMEKSVLTFLSSVGVIDQEKQLFGKSIVVEDTNFVSVHASKGGFFLSDVVDSGFVREGERLASIVDPLTGEVSEALYAPCKGHLYYSFNSSMTHQGTLLFQIIPD